MKITFLTGSVSRKAGGIFYTLRRLSQVLNMNNIEVDIISKNDEFTISDFNLWKPLKPITYKPLLYKKFDYNPKLNKLILLSRPDIIHNQGIWTYNSLVSLNWKLFTGGHIVTSPHGMLDNWAINNSYLKKLIISRLFEYKHLKESNCIHALCSSESKSIREYGLSNPICNIPNGIDLPIKKKYKIPEWRKRISSNRKILLFLSRLHEKKGVDKLIKAFYFLKKKNALNNWSLIIAGWGKNDYIIKLKNLIKNLHLEKEILFIGPQFNESKEATYYHADAYILPSFSEGLPISVLEAWSYKLPVIMTSYCNLPEGFNRKAALEIQPNPANIARVLENLFNMTDDERKYLGKNGYRLVKEKFVWENVADDFIKVYRWLLGESNKIPSSVICNSN